MPRPWAPRLFMNNLHQGQAKGDGVGLSRVKLCGGAGQQEIRAPERVVFK